MGKDKNDDGDKTAEAGRKTHEILPKALEEQPGRATPAPAADNGAGRRPRRMAKEGERHTRRRVIKKPTRSS